MALPKITTYQAPSATDLPKAKVSWTLDPARTALLVHDMQRHFIKSFTPDAEPLPTLFRNIARLTTHCDSLSIPVFYCAQPGDQNPLDRGLQQDFWGPGMTATDGNPDIVAEVTPRDNHVVVTKWRYSAFQRTNIERMLRSRGRDQLIVCGVYAHIGCLLTVADAFMRDIQPFMVADAVADFSREKHDSALEYVSGHCGIVLDTDSVIGALSK